MMSTRIIRSARLKGRSRALLKTSAITWFCIAAVGQFAFAAYIAVFFGGKAMEMDWAGMTRHLIVGIVDGDTVGNFNLLVHLLLAFVITAAGPLQFIPAIRRRYSPLHRWIGRTYGVVAVLISMGALYLTWVRGMLGFIPQLAISIDGVLILVFAFLTVRAALARNFADHHRWALRLFVAASGVWFFRIGYGFWLIVSGGTMPGVGPLLDGPFDLFLMFGCHLIPLMVLEFYQYARDRSGVAVHYAASALVFSGAAITGIGIVGAAMMFWLPRLTG